MNSSLTPYELKLVTDANILLTKNKIIQTVCDFFGELTGEYKKQLGEELAYTHMLINAKVSRGENYKGLPYVMLDFPRQFTKDNVFAIRTFFWWGNFFSITLQLSGESLRQCLGSIQNAVDSKVFKEWYLSSGSTEWDHHFEENNYVLIGEEKLNIRDRPFLKLAKKIPLTQWDEAKKFFIENFQLLIGVLKD